MAVHVQVDSCDNCDAGNFTCRVTGGSLEPGQVHESVYACDDCVSYRLADIRLRFPDAQVHPFKKR